MLCLAEFYLPAGSTLATVVHCVRAGAKQAAGTRAGVVFVEAIFLPYQAQRAADVAAARSAAGWHLAGLPTH